MGFLTKLRNFISFKGWKEDEELEEKKEDVERVEEKQVDLEGKPVEEKSKEEKEEEITQKKIDEQNKKLSNLKEINVNLGRFSSARDIGRKVVSTRVGRINVDSLPPGEIQTSYINLLNDAGIHDNQLIKDILPFREQILRKRVVAEVILYGDAYDSVNGKVSVKENVEIGEMEVLGVFFEETNIIYNWFIGKSGRVDELINGFESYIDQTNFIGVERKKSRAVSVGTVTNVRIHLTFK